MPFFWVKLCIILSKLAQSFFLHLLKNKKIFNFVIFVATKKGRTTNFFHPSLLLLFLNPGIGVPRSGIRDEQKSESGSGINMPDPLHCDKEINETLTIRGRNFVIVGLKSSLFSLGQCYGSHWFLCGSR